jgi:catechol 2,3-dioxygenase-like lactoylglutathione lyase family enzyme
MIRAFHHVKLDVADLDRALAFYVGLLGFKVIARYDVAGSHTIAQVSPNGEPPGIELWHEPPYGPLGDDRLHVAWTTDDVVGMVRTLEAKGVTIERQPFTIGHETLAFVRDPDGYLIELNQS